MAAPQFSPTPVVDSARSYSSPDRVPSAWMPNRPGEITGFQPQGERLGYQGPDQGFAIKIANGFTDRLQLQPGEHAADVIKGCLGIGLRRASLFSRAPVVHDLTIAFTIWGSLDPSPPAELVAARGPLFAGLGQVARTAHPARPPGRPEAQHRQALAGQGRLGGLQSDDIDQPRVGGDGVALLKDQDVAGHDFGRRDLSLIHISEPTRPY